MVHAFQLLFIDCNYPRAFVWWIGMHAVMFLFLFNEFYKSTYKVNIDRVSREIRVWPSGHQGFHFLSNPLITPKKLSTFLLHLLLLLQLLSILLLFFSFSLSLCLSVLLFSFAQRVEETWGWAFGRRKEITWDATKCDEKQWYERYQWH